LKLASISASVRFLENRGAAWGARRQVVQRAQAAVSEVLETLVLLKLAEGNVEIKAGFDEYNLELEVSYAGKPFPAAGECPSPDELLADADSVLRLSGMLVRQHADHVAFAVRHNKQVICLHYDH
jgi:NCS2 family nucleobase:cation symporter-2